jgi:hypothetical protein
MSIAVMMELAAPMPAYSRREAPTTWSTGSPEERESPPEAPDADEASMPAPILRASASATR